MKSKRIISLITALSIVLVIMLTACNSQGGSGTPKSGDSPTLVWWVVGNGTMPENYQQALDKMNTYTSEKIGVKIDVKVASWGDWDTKINTIVNSGEAFDIMFTNNSKYAQQVSLKAFEDITSLVEKEAPDLWSFIPSKVWDGTRIGGKIFAVPTYKDSSLTQYWVIDNKYAEKYNIDIQNVKTMEDLYTATKAIKDGEGSKVYPVPLTQGDGFNGFFNSAGVGYDDLTLGIAPIGVQVNDASRTVVCTLEQADVMANLVTLHKMYKDGIINPDAATAKEPSKGRIFFTAQAFPGAEANWQINEGVEKYVMSQNFGPIYTTSTIQGSMNAISANSKYKTQGLKYLQLVNTDSKLRNMLAYGEEGKDFESVEGDKMVRRISDTWPLAAYTQGTFFNMAVTEGAPIDQWDQVKKLNEQASSSVCLGFAFDQSNVTNEIANCRATWDKYRFELLTGTSDPEAVVSQIVSELKSSGMDKIIAEAQSQINAYFK